MKQKENVAKYLDLQAQKFLFCMETNDRFRNYGVAETMETNFSICKSSFAITIG